MKMSVSLLTHINKMLTSHGVIKHGGSFDFLEDLSSEESGLFLEVVDLSSGVREHKSEGTLCVLEGGHGLVDFIRGSTPFLDVLSLKKSFLIL